MTGEFLERFAAALVDAGLGAAHHPLTAAEQDMVLELARLVAHGTERKNAPLATFVAAMAISGGAPGEPREALLELALEVARSAAGTHPHPS